MERFSENLDTFFDDGQRFGRNIVEDQMVVGTALDWVPEFSNQYVGAPECPNTYSWSEHLGKCVAY